MKRILSLLLVILLAVSMFPWSASAATVTKQETKRAIAIVFDNSGSMYDSSTPEAWCRATYAMEAFANMLNANDVMQIYPMHPISVTKDGREVEADMNNPLNITQKEASIIQSIYTPFADGSTGTPIATIPAALSGLEEISADEKWLIVLSDGTYFHSKEGDRLDTTRSTEELNAELRACWEKVNVMYLGIGKNPILPDELHGGNAFVCEHAEDSADVLNKLSSMCNTIFGRNNLPGVTKSSSDLSFNVSMNKLILLVQGENITDVKLNGISPNSASDLKYATRGCGGYDFGYGWKEDKTLQGSMVIYEWDEANRNAATNAVLSSGTYSLSYSGTATSVDCYYEPNVDISVELVDEAGNVVDPANLVAGTYYIRYGVVDAATGEMLSQDVIDEFLKTTNYQISYVLNGEAVTEPFTEAGEIKLEMAPDSTLKDAMFRVTYLGGYTIERPGTDFGWPEIGLAFPAPDARPLTITMTGGQNDYVLSKLTAGETFKLDFAYDGIPLTNDQLSRLEQLKVTLEGGDGTEGMQPVTATLKQNGGYYVELGYGGSAVLTQCGSYHLKVTGQYRNEDDKLTALASAEANFTVTDDSRQLTMEVTASDGYYQISELGSAAPIIVKLLYSGQNLTEEELKSFEPTLSNLQGHLVRELDVAQSAYIYRFNPDNPPAEGDYELQITVSGVNEIGRPQKQSHELEYSFGLWPMWLKILIPILIILIILLIIWFIMNQPRLPKNIYVKGMDFIVDGSPIAVTKTPKFTGAGKKKGTINISSPKAGNDPFADQAMNLTVKAVSPRRTKSKNRKALVTNATVARPNNVIYWRLKSSAYVPDPDSAGSFISSTNGKPGFKQVEIGNGSEVEIQAETDSSSVIFKCKLGFK